MIIEGFSGFSRIPKHPSTSIILKKKKSDMGFHPIERIIHLKDALDSFQLEIVNHM